MQLGRRLPLSSVVLQKVKGVGRVIDQLRSIQDESIPVVPDPHHLKDVSAGDLAEAADLDNPTQERVDLARCKATQRRQIGIVGHILGVVEATREIVERDRRDPGNEYALEPALGRRLHALEQGA